MLSLDLQGQVALVTASSRGIGRSCALMLGRAGARVVVNYLSDKSAAASAAKEIQQAGGEAIVVQGDASDVSQVEGLVQAALAQWGRIDILVANAGARVRVPLLKTGDDDFQKIFGDNVLSFVALVRAAAPRMIERRYGRIVAMSSWVGKSGHGFSSTSPNYAGAKAAMIGYVKGMAHELGPHGITVNGICPGWIDWGTKHTDALPAVRERALEQIPLKRTGTPEDIAGAVLYFASPWAGYTTGVALDINGGLYMA